MKLNFADVKLRGFDGEEIPSDDLCKKMGQLMYFQTKDLDLSPKGLLVKDGIEVEFDKVEVEELKRLIKWVNPQSGIQAFLAYEQKAVLDYIEKKTKEHNEPIPNED